MVYDFDQLLKFLERVRNLNTADLAPVEQQIIAQMGQCLTAASESLPTALEMQKAEIDAAAGK